MWAPSRPRVRALVLAAAVFLPAAALPAVEAPAGTLSIRTTSTVAVTGGILRADIRYTNAGSAEALAVQAHMTVPGRVLSSPVTERLGPGGAASAVFEAPVEGISGSSYPFIVYVDFKDENGYPFSALSCGTFSYGGEGPSQIECAGSEARLSDEGMVGFVVSNPGSHALETTARLVLPREFVSASAVRALSLGPGEAARVDFRVRNAGALAGASYPFFCVVEYETGGRRGAAVGSSTVSVEGRENLFRRHRALWVAVVVVAGLLFAWVLLREKASRDGG